MIITMSGNVKYPITLDPSVWIFDERRIKFEDAFTKKANETEEETEYTSDERFNREVFQATNDNKPIPRKDHAEILSSTYVIPFEPFYKNSEVNEDATGVAIVQGDGNEVNLTLEQLKNCLLLFSNKGKMLKEDGPVYLYFGDGSNKDEPIKSIKKIVIQ